MVSDRLKYSKLKFAATALFVMLLGCGGGTSGTGLRSIRGHVGDSSGQPLGGTAITIAETGAATLSDESGLFVLQSDASLPSVTLHLSGDSFDTSVNVDLSQHDHEEVNLDVSVDTANNSAEAVRLDFSTVESFDVQVDIVGGCARAFSEQTQVRPLPDGLFCDLEVHVSGDGEALGGVLVSLERQACGKAKPWRTFATGLTQTQPHAGFLPIRFRFFANERACRYRVVAPFGDDKKRQSIVIIKTLAAR